MGFLSNLTLKNTTNVIDVVHTQMEIGAEIANLERRIQRQKLFAQVLGEIERGMPGVEFRTGALVHTVGPNMIYPWKGGVIISRPVPGAPPNQTFTLYVWVPLEPSKNPSSKEDSPRLWWSGESEQVYLETDPQWPGKLRAVLARLGGIDIGASSTAPASVEVILPGVDT